jgi:tetratricopeptide (TPR) repeat protein
VVSRDRRERSARSAVRARALPTVARGQEVLASDPAMPFYAGVIHETFASPTVQNIVAAASSRPNVVLAIKSAAIEAGLAEAAFRRALDLDPAFGEARLHLGHVLHQLGRDDDAVDELERASDTLTLPELRYFLALFLGQAEAGRGHGDAAHGAFARAHALFPLAQSPLLAESHLSRREDDPARALATLRQILALPTAPEARDDPWWSYDISASRDADTLMRALYRRFQPEGAR